MNIKTVMYLIKMSKYKKYIKRQNVFLMQSAKYLNQIRF